MAGDEAGPESDVSSRNEVVTTTDAQRQDQQQITLENPVNQKIEDRETNKELEIQEADDQTVLDVSLDSRDSLDSAKKAQSSAPSTDEPVQQPTSLKRDATLETKHEGDLLKLQLICIKFAENQHSIDETERSKTTDSILQLLVTEDMSSIRSAEILNSLFIDHLHILPPKIISELLSVLIAIVKKSVFHLESARGLLIPSINHLISSEHSNTLRKQHSDNKQHESFSSASSVSLTKHFLREWVNLLIVHSCDVEELKTILKFSEIDPTLLSFIQQANMKQRLRPAAFFAFPGSKGSMMSLPPLQKWPMQTGWSFSTWFFLEPKACAQPYLYNLRTGKSGLGYSAYFTGNCLVLTSIRVKGKGVQHCIAYEFPSYKWTHCAITYHNKWRASEVKVYVNGQLSANIEMAWQVQTTEIFDKCFIGGSGPIATNSRTSSELHSLCGQMSAVYLFNEGLTPAQICAIHRLGSSYMGQFKYSNESHVNLPPQICKALYGEKLASSLFCLYSPVAVDSGTLCIQLAPLKSSTTPSAPNYFVSAPHAALLGHTKAITTRPICSTLQSLGCSHSLLPLLDAFSSKEDWEACASLIGFLCDLLESSPHWFANEIVQNNGFVMVACALASNARVLLSDRLLDIFLNLTRTLLTTSSTIGDSLLLKHLMDNILFNPSLWVYSDIKLQIKLYSYLATEFLHGTRNTTNKYTISNTSSASSYVAYNPTSSAAYALSNQNTMATQDDQSKTITSVQTPSCVTDMIFSEVRRVSTVLQSLHALKYYYWAVEEKEIHHKARDSKLRPSRQDLSAVRKQILALTKELVLRSNSAPVDEIQGILNYLSTCNEAENLLDVLEVLASMLNDHPTSIVPALDQKHGIRVIFKLIGSRSEQIRIKALKFLALFMSKCANKKKQDIMGPNNLFMLLCDKLRTYRPMTLETYEALLCIMLELPVDIGGDLPADGTMKANSISDLSKKKIENSIVIKVIATLLHEERSCYSPIESDSSCSNIDTRKIFINDLWNLIICSRENRRIILQMSVWQHWLINLIDSTIDDSQLIRDQILAIFRVLLYHAIRYEYGGWRVWIDTLAIIHTKVSYDEFNQRLNRNQDDSNKRDYEREHEHQKPASEIKVSETSRIATSAKSECLADKNISDEEGAEPAESSEKVHTVVSSISELIPRENSGIQMEEDDGDHGVDEPDAKSLVDSVGADEMTDQMREVDLNNTTAEKSTIERSLDSVDLAPSREYRKISLNNQSTSSPSPTVPVDNHSEIGCRQPSLTSIALDEPSTALQDNVEEKQNSDCTYDHATISPGEGLAKQQARAQSATSKAYASPAFRIPEFKWGSMLIKLLNDLMFSIECDLYNWRCLAKCSNLDTLPFVPKTSGGANSNPKENSSSNNGSQARSVTSSNSNSTTLSSTGQIESFLQRAENQIYIINVVHFVSQLADNIIIASGGLLPLLADATGGSRSTSTATTKDPSSTCEGLTTAQANSILYRLVNMVDLVIFAASHINLSELEADKNTTSGGILRQCLRLACTVTVKNCLILRSCANCRCNPTDASGGTSMSPNDFPKDTFDSYQGCSLLSANGLFENSALMLEDSDLIASTEFSPHQTPNTSSMPSLLPFQSTPIKDSNKLLQWVDINRIQACIYHDFSTESRQSQFLALSSLYFISVLMVSKYRDIIEPKQRQTPGTSHRSTDDRSSPSSSTLKSIDSGLQNGGSSSVSSIESNLLTFGKMQPNATVQQQHGSGGGSALTDMLTTKLENTLDTICPLLKSIMCDFCGFLSKTLIGSHGQDLVNKEADRTFRRTNTSPVELVMLLCSQEWQNTLQKNAGLAFIELINEGRVLSHGMKDHIVRVAMEAEFILSRLRADDVAKHELFHSACVQSLAARLHEESLINSLISSAARRDHLAYLKFKESIEMKHKSRHYKLDIWEDDDRRRRRFVIDSWDDSQQCLYSSNSVVLGASTKVSASTFETNNNNDNKNNETKRILELQQSMERGGIDDHCSSTGAQQDEMIESPIMAAGGDKDEANCEFGDDEDFEEDQQDSLGSDSGEQLALNRQGAIGARDNHRYDEALTSLDGSRLTREAQRGGHNLFSQQQSSLWDYGDECGSMREFNGSVIFAAECSLIWSIYAITGLFQVTAHEIYFEPNQNVMEAVDILKKQQADDEELTNSKLGAGDGKNKQPGEGQQLRKPDYRVLRYCDFLCASNGKLLLADIRAIYSRHYLLQPHALEVFLSQRTSVMFAFNDFDTVKRVVKHLPPVGVGIKYGIPQTRRASLMTPRQLFAASNMQQKWQKREIGNFQYLMFLNTIAGRTYQDLNQYPVFPWILTNYESEVLDLNLPSNFRDLSKPVGVLNNKRRNEFVERYESWDNPKVPAFHYGTHYSTAAFALNWLCRLRGAYNSAYLALQDGKYEEDSRLFLSIGDSWVSALTGGQQNVKELVPEFFHLPEMFHSNLGLPEVEYPPWANQSAEQFTRLHRLALESELVSCQLHQWIDLIFGYKQRGPEAVNAINTFYYLTYQGNVNLNMIQDSSLREAIETQIKHFGQTPSQLTTEPHPPRFSALHVSPMIFAPSASDDVNEVVKFPFNNPVVHISPCISNHIALTSQSSLADSPASGQANFSGLQVSEPSSILTITANNQYQIHKWSPSSCTDQASLQPLVIDPQLEQTSNPAARRQLIDVEDLCPGISLKITNRADINNLEEVSWICTHYVVTLDGRYIIIGSFYDNSFRVFITESGKLCQVIYSHQGPITCMARSAGNAAGDFYLATGSQDCSLLLWTWNERFSQVEGSGVSAVHNPLPKLSIHGHQCPVLSALICAELGLIVSGSRNSVLVHTTLRGESLLDIEVTLAGLLTRSPYESRVYMADGKIQRPQVKDKQRTILEASMLGEEGTQRSLAKAAVSQDKTNLQTLPESSRSPSLSSQASERFSHLRDLCKSDYYITGLQVARELAYIVCVALPPPKRKPKTLATSHDEALSSVKHHHNTSSALLMTFNLKGALMNSTTIGQPINCPRLGDICAMQTTYDGEHIILNDSPTTLKVYRTFDLQAVYAFNTNDITSSLSEDHNKIRSLTLIDHKYILVGLDNGRIVVYNADFKNLR